MKTTKPDTMNLEEFKLQNYGEIGTPNRDCQVRIRTLGSGVQNMYNVIKYSVGKVGQFLSKRIPF